MKALAISLCALVLIGSHNAVSQTVTPRSVAQQRITTGKCAVLQNICTLDPNYKPVPNLTYGKDDPSYTRPSCQSPSTAAERSLIRNTIDQTSGQLRKDLCNLDNIFILRNVSSRSWGFYESPDYHTTSGYTAIALNTDDLNVTFSTKQNNNNRIGLGITNGNHNETSLPTSVVPETWGLLYVLAHELGHIKWHKAAYDRNCPNAIRTTWSSLGQSRWTGFNEQFGTRDTNVVPQPPTNLSQAQLNNAYKGEFATALAAANSEEDFVESYALRAVNKACNGCKFTLDISTGNSVDLMDNNRGSNKLKGKFNCGDNSAR